MIASSIMKKDEKRLCEVLQGKEAADLLIKNISLINPVTAEIHTGSLAIAEGHIVGWKEMAAKKVLDGKGYFLSPGLIDSHIHVESTMLPPSEFARAVIAHGTTAVVADPHEVGNVGGMEGLNWMMRQGRESPLNFYWAAPSCVPASPLDTPGAVLGVEEITDLLAMENVVSLGEVMNYPGVIHGDSEVHAKIAAAKARGLAVDGHAPGLTGQELFAYVAAGIETDHECTRLKEAEEKLRLGVLIQMRQGSAEHNLNELLPLIKTPWTSRLMFSTDDRNPVDLSEKGHLNEHLRLCVAGGIDPAVAVRIATLNPARHYRLSGQGTLSPGSKADVVLFKDLKNFDVDTVIIGGNVIYREGYFLASMEHGKPSFPSSMRVKNPVKDALTVHREGDLLKVIKLIPNQVVTEKGYYHVPPGDIVKPNLQEDILKIAVFERHHDTGNVGVGFVQGFGFKTGAVATTVAHDSHHLIVAGTNDDDMLIAVKKSTEMQGGIAVARNGEVLATLPLPLFGLMSDQPLQALVKQFKEVHAAVNALGGPLKDPLMQISFLALPVIPTLKITDKGLVDVTLFSRVPLFGE
jgi:adenine deaminase